MNIMNISRETLHPWSKVAVTYIWSDGEVQKKNTSKVLTQHLMVSQNIKTRYASNKILTLALSFFFFSFSFFDRTEL